jgi:lipoprotein-anchoring transpeptidase ErfK/SrfK
MNRRNLLKMAVLGAGVMSPMSSALAANEATVVIIVSAGQTLYQIAARYGTTVSAIMQANGLRNSRIYVGQRLIVPTSGGVTAPAPAPQPAPASGKSIYVNLTTQRVAALQNGQAVMNFICSTGRPGQRTITGNFRVKTKLPQAYASTWGLRMPYWMGIYDAGSLENGFHSLPINRYGQKMWAGLLGTPASFGCIVLRDSDAAALYNWAPMGTSVVIRY